MGTYIFSGAAQYVTVQADGIYDITAFGAQGGAGIFDPGGRGAEIEGSFQLTAGERLEIIAGGVGGSSPRGAGGGGGGSFVLANTTGVKGQYTLLLAAGGGGGSGGTGVSASAPGGAGSDMAGTGYGGAGGSPVNGGGGGSGYKSSGDNDVFLDQSFSYGGSNRTGNYAGGKGLDGPSNGGFGGGGGGDFENNGSGGGGGGYSGGNGGKFTYGGGGGGSAAKGAIDGSVTALAGVHTGAGLVTIAPSVACFATGTLIRTAHGDVAVERLRIGDRVVTASGAARPIRWLGHRAIDLRRHPSPDDARPIRIAAHAFGEDRPARDLLVSPAHAICVDVVGEVLIPARAMANGATIGQVTGDSVTYWHVELDSHDILFAENLPSESYVDTGNRGFFANAASIDPTVGPDGDPARRGSADFCRPFHEDDHLVEVVRERLRARALALGRRPVDAGLDSLRSVAQLPRRIVSGGTRNATAA